MKTPQWAFFLKGNSTPVLNSFNKDPTQEVMELEQNEAIVEHWIPKTLFFSEYPAYRHAFYVQIDTHIVVYECPALTSCPPFFFTLEDAQQALALHHEKNRA